MDNRDSNGRNVKEMIMNNQNNNVFEEFEKQIAAENETLLKEQTDKWNQLQQKSILNKSKQIKRRKKNKQAKSSRKKNRR